MFTKNIFFLFIEIRIIAASLQGQPRPANSAYFKTFLCLDYELNQKMVLINIDQ